MNCETELSVPKKKTEPGSNEITEETAANMTENSDENASAPSNEEEANPYAYLERSGFTSEKYKIEIMNLHKFCTPNVSDEKTVKNLSK